MRIYTAWAAESEGGDLPWLISSYDEFTGSEHNGTPQFHLKAIADAESTGYIVRSLVIDIDDETVPALFEVPTVTPLATLPEDGEA